VKDWTAPPQASPTPDQPAAAPPVSDPVLIVAPQTAPHMPPLPHLSPALPAALPMIAAVPPARPRIDAHQTAPAQPVPQPRAEPVVAPRTTRHRTADPATLVPPEPPQLDTTPALAEPPADPSPRTRPVARPEPPAHAAPAATAAGGDTGAVRQVRQPSAAAQTGKPAAHDALQARWGAQIQRKVHRRLIYPHGATGAGTTRVALSVSPSGQLTRLHVLHSSGVAAFDEAALTAVRRAGRFPAAPDGLSEANYSFTLSLTFQR
jgi:protein TonB